MRQTSMQDSYETTAYTTVDEGELARIAAFVRECESIDGISACFQPEVVVDTESGKPSFVACHHLGVLVGVLSVFSMVSDEVELSVCVHPAHRRKGIATRLVDEAMVRLAAVGTKRFLLVSDANSPAGMAFVESQKGQPHHAEYSLRYDTDHRWTAIPQQLQIRRAGPDDIDALVNIVSLAFGDVREDVEGFIRASMEWPAREVFVGLVEGVCVATASVGHDDATTASINMVAVDPRVQGKGYATELIQALVLPLVENHIQVLIDVDSTNARAYRLYRHLGFIETRVVEYRSLAWSTTR